MVKACCVSSCKEHWGADKSVTFFAFPIKNEALREKWLRAGPGYKTVSKYSTVCSKHFSPEDWTAYGGIRKLKKNTVPSIFNFGYSTAIDNKIYVPDDHNYSICGSSSEVIVGNEPQETILQTLSNEFDAEARSSEKQLQESGDDERPAKKFCSVAVQTCPRLSGPSDREKELQAKIHILQGRLRRRDKKISNVKDLIAHLKDAGKCSDNLEEKFGKTFTNFDVELFKNEEKNNNAKNAKTYTQEMKDFASTLYSYSPRAYEFVREKINLPHASTLRRWKGDNVIDAGSVDCTSSSPVGI